MDLGSFVFSRGWMKQIISNDIHPEFFSSLKRGGVRMVCGYGSKSFGIVLHGFSRNFNNVSESNSFFHRFVENVDFYFFDQNFGANKGDITFS